jgi:hypothetical protein
VGRDFARPPWLPSESQTRLLKACLADDDSWKTVWRDWRERVGGVQPDAISIKLLPLIYWKLGSTDIDDPLGELARSVYLQTLAQNLRREERLADILEHFEEAGVEGMLLKGAASSAAYYPSRGLRDMVDIDLFVRPDEVGRAWDVLIRHGWHAYLGATPGQIRGQMRVRHGWSFTRDTENEIDLHWHPVAYCYAPDVAGSFWRHARWAEVAGVAVRVPDATEQLFHVCTHAIQLMWNPSVRWIADAITILRVADGEVDWDRLGRIASAARMTIRLRVSFEYLQREFAANIPDESLRHLTPARAAAWERKEAALHARKPPLGVWDYLRWHWWHFRRVRPFDDAWRRVPAIVGFLDYVRIWGRAHPLERARRFVRMRAPRAESY